MAISPQKRQRKIERQRAKSKVKHRALVQRKSLGLAARFERVAAAPFLDCCIAESLWDQGMGNVLVSRQLDNGNVAFAVFLVDAYCLGVKDAFGAFVVREKYDEDLHDRLLENCELRDVQPACARKLVEEAVAYAADLGFDPHPDYRRLKAIFGAIEPSKCTMTFTFGRDGKPFFIAGPNDGYERCERILRTLENRNGPEGYHYTMPLFGT